MNIFEQGTKLNLLFPTCRGHISILDLWNLPLTSKDGFNLDAVARTVNTELKASTEESFVKPIVTTAAALLELRLEILKHIIASKIADISAATARKARSDERQRLLKLLDEKDEEKLKALSAEEIRNRLKELDQ